MSEMHEIIKKSNRAIYISVVALIIALGSFFIKPKSSPYQNINQNITTGLLDRIEKTGELHAGYGVYPPYSLENPNTKEVSGFSVEIIVQIAKELKCKVIWHRINWNTMSADLKRGEFDLIADPIFQTIPRAREFAFTEPYAYFADGIGVVKINEARFNSFDDLERADITINVGQGWASETLVKNRFTKPNIVSVQTSSDLLQIFNNVITGRADIAIADGADVERFIKEHSNQVKALWLDNPPAAMPAGFALRTDDKKSAEFLTVCLRNLKATGVLIGLAKKYSVATLKVPKWYY